MTATSPIEQLLEIESKVLSHKENLPQVAEAVAEWRGVGFKIGNAELVVSMLDVVEVLDPVTCTRIPSSKIWFEGIANIRGQLVPITNLYGFLHSEVPAATMQERVIIFRFANSITGLLVSAVTGIRSFRADSMTQNTQALDEPLSSYIMGAFPRIGDDEVPVFDFMKLANSEQFLSISELSGLTAG